jgi:hypothetical protein
LATDLGEKSVIDSDSDGLNDDVELRLSLDVL